MKKRIGCLLLITMFIVLTMIPMRASAAEDTLIDGWYYLRCMYNYLNITKDGKAELRKLNKNEAFYVEHKSDNLITLKMKNGKYLGLKGNRKNGERVVAVDKPLELLEVSLTMVLLR